MSKIQIVMIAAVLLPAFSGGVIAQDDTGLDSERGKRPGHHRGPGRGIDDPRMMLERMVQYLELDQVQQQTVAKIMDASKPEFDALREASRANREAIHALDVSDSEYGARLTNLSAKSGELAAGLALLKGRIRGEIAAVLTEDQLAVLEDRMSRRGERRRPFRSDRAR